MGNYTGTVRLRESMPNTAAALVETFNAIDSAIVGCGMIRVSGSDFTGQSGTFVTTSPGSGETQVTLGTTSEHTLVGYKVYKHPTLSIYLRVEFFDNGYVTTTSRSSSVRYSIGTALTGGGFVTLATQTDIRPQSKFISNGNTCPLTVETANYANLYASCGADHFWIYSRPTIAFSTIIGRASYPHGISSHGIGVFTAAENTAELLVVAPAEIDTADLLYYGLDIAITPFNAASRYWTYDGTLWLAGKAGSAGYLLDPYTTSNADGVRIGRAEKHINGLKRHFNIGFINGGSASDGDLLSIDLLGAGATNYMACHALGPSSPIGYAAIASNNSALVSIPLLPWAV